MVSFSLLDTTLIGITLNFASVTSMGLNETLTFLGGSLLHFCFAVSSVPLLYCGKPIAQFTFVPKIYSFFLREQKQGKKKTLYQRRLIFLSQGILPFKSSLKNFNKIKPEVFSQWTVVYKYLYFDSVCFKQVHNVFDFYIGIKQQINQMLSISKL